MKPMRGFTLIELVMVMVLIAVVSIMVIPRLFSVSDTQLRKDAKVLTNYLGFAQELAMSRSDSYGVCFDLALNRYTLNVTDCTNTANIIPSPEDRGSPLQVEPDATITIAPAGTTSVFFDYMGRPAPDGVTITLTTGASTATVLVEPKTGFVHEN